MLSFFKRKFCCSIGGCNTKNCIYEYCQVIAIKIINYERTNASQSIYKILGRIM